MAFGVMFAGAHEWYPPECCSDKDCYQITAADVRPTDDGYWLIVLTGEKVKSKGYSPDGQYHRCSYGGVREAGTICLFVPLPAGS